MVSVLSVDQSQKIGVTCLEPKSLPVGFYCVSYVVGEVTGWFGCHQYAEGTQLYLLFSSNARETVEGLKINKHDKKCQPRLSTHKQVLLYSGQVNLLTLR